MKRYCIVWDDYLNCGQFISLDISRVSIIVAPTHRFSACPRTSDRISSSQDVRRSDLLCWLELLWDLSPNWQQHSSRSPVWFEKWSRRPETVIGYRMLPGPSVFCPADICLSSQNENDLVLCRKKIYLYIILWGTRSFMDTFSVEIRWPRNQIFPIKYPS